MYVCMYARMYVCVRVCVDVYIHIYIHMYAYIYSTSMGLGSMFALCILGGSEGRQCVVHLPTLREADLAKLLWQLSSPSS